MAAPISARTESTRTLYTYVWSQWERRCAARGIPALPGDPLALWTYGARAEERGAIGVPRPAVVTQRGGQHPAARPGRSPSRRSVADGYAIFACYLRHRPEADGNMAEQQRLGAELQARLEAIYPPEGLRARLLTRLDK